MFGQAFISNSTRNEPIVTALTQGLEAYGCRVWCASREMAPGDLLVAEPPLQGAFRLEIPALA